MRLYFSPFSCSLSPHIALCEAGLDYTLTRVDLKTKRTDDGRDFWSINPKGYVPALELDDGQLLTEGAAIVQYVADLVPERELAPPHGTLQRYRLQEWLSYVSGELHKQFSPLFAPNPGDVAAQHRKLGARIALLERTLAATPYLLGEGFCVADGYAFTVLSWSRSVRLDLSPFPAVQDFLKRVAARPAVKLAQQRELALRPALAHT